MSDRHTLAEGLSKLGISDSLSEIKRVSGGCINECFALDAGDRRWFVKLNGAAHLDMFRAEQEGLAALAATATLRVPEPLGSVVAADHALLVLEHIELGGPPRAATAGAQLAELHRVSGTYFGWTGDNFIGLTPQLNTAGQDWIEFWQTQRLGAQLELARSNGFGTELERGERLVQELPALFVNYRPQPSLLHGDLWAGNLDYTPSGEAVIFDPAVYYGDRETDIAMTELFGGFGADFHAAYQEAWPLEQGYPVRKRLYNLYHVLNHLNLFGGGYLGQASALIDQLLAELN